MDREQLFGRIKQFALRIINLSSSLPRNRAGDVIGRQILRSGTSIGANYCEAMRASSKRQFVAMVEISAREAGETLYWLELLAESNTVKPSLLSKITQECQELVAILSATARSAKRRL